MSGSARPSLVRGRTTGSLPARKAHRSRPIVLTTATVADCPGYRVGHHASGELQWYGRHGFVHVRFTSDVRSPVAPSPVRGGAFQHSATSTVPAAGRQIQLRRWYSGPGPAPRGFVRERVA